MELRQLQTFTLAAELLSFTRAARALGVSQPAVSQQVAALERELGVSLFQRSGRTITLSNAGWNLYPYARKALDLIDQARDSLAETPRTLKGRLRIASCTIPPESFLPEVLAAFHQLFPEVLESVSVSDSAEATQAVKSGQADLGFVVVPPNGSGLRIRAVACHELVLVASPEHPFAHARTISVSDLRGEGFVLREQGSGTRHCVEEVLQDAGIPPADLNVTMETNSNDAIRGALRQGTGIAFLSRAAVEDEISQGRLVALKVRDLRPRVHIYLITDSQRVPTPQARAFLAFLELPEAKR